MQRSISTSLLRLSKTSFAQTSKRALSTTTRATKSNAKWIAPASILSVGLATYLLSSSPLALDTKAKETTTSTKPAKAEKTEVVATEEQQEQTATKDATTASATEGESEEQEPVQQSAYNPETGEINWDCPCLGGMAHGPCGEEFKEAFSCFVYSESDPKGFDCIEKFKNMQNCFRKYPDVYSEEIRDDEGPVETLEVEQPAQQQEEQTTVIVTEETPVIVAATPVIDIVEVVETPEKVEVVEEVITLPVAEGAEPTKSD